MPRRGFRVAPPRAPHKAPEIAPQIMPAAAPATASKTVAPCSSGSMKQTATPTSAPAAPPDIQHQKPPAIIPYQTPSSLSRLAARRRLEDGSTAGMLNLSVPMKRDIQGILADPDGPASLHSFLVDF